jgi:predicted MPP superfamily phosphohydrolase
MTVERLPAMETGLEQPIYLHRANIRTASPRSTNTFKFLVFGDSGSGSDEQKALAELMKREQPDFMVHTGDLAYTFATYEEFLTRHFNIYSELLSSVPLFPCLGNHEYYTNDAKPYRTLHVVPVEGVPEEGRGRYYSFDWGPLHMVSLDTNESLVAAVNGKNSMLEWVENDLKMHKNALKMAFFHHPPYTAGRHKGDYWSALAEERIVPILERHGVHLVLNGHDHNYQRSVPVRQGREVNPVDGITYLVTGGGGGSLYELTGHPLIATGRSVYHYLRATVADAKLKIEAVSIENEVFDSLDVPLQALVSSA